jgi:hypothetical protein
LNLIHMFVTVWLKNAVGSVFFCVYFACFTQKNFVWIFP